MCAGSHGTLIMNRKQVGGWHTFFVESVLRMLGVGSLSYHSRDDHPPPKPSARLS